MGRSHARRQDPELIEAGTAVFCLNPSKGMTGDDMADAFAAALPRILRMVAANPEGGYVKGVSRRGAGKAPLPKRFALTQAAERRHAD